YLANTDYVDTSAGSALVASLGASSGNTYSQLQAYTAGRIGPGSLVFQPLAGNVGIATTTPLSKLSVSGNQSIGADYNIAAPTYGLIVEGNVGIGNTSPSYKLDVAGDINTSAGSAYRYNGAVI